MDPKFLQSMRRRYELPPEMDSQADYDACYGRKSNRNSAHSVPYYAGIIVVVYLLVLYCSVYFVDDSLPKALNIADEVSSFIIKSNYSC